MTECRLPARDPVSLEHAFRWRCECQTVNYVDPVVIVFKDEEARRTAYLRIGLIDVHQETPPASDGMFIRAPEIVVCRSCRRRFPAVDESDTIEMEVDDGEG